MQQLTDSVTSHYPVADRAAASIPSPANGDSSPAVVHATDGRPKLGWMSRHRVRRALRGEQLACGCVIGIYELYSGDIVSVIDDRAPTCGNRQHQPHVVIATDSSSRRPEHLQGA